MFRDGEAVKIETSSIVPGDVVEIKVGDNIPADVILITTIEMKVNNASLTGESEDMLRQPDAKNPSVFESGNVALCILTCLTRNLLLKLLHLCSQLLRLGLELLDLEPLLT